MKKCEYTLTLKNERGEQVLFLQDRKTRLIKQFISRTLDDKWISPEDLFAHLKFTKKLNIAHLVNYAFSRRD